MYSTVYVWTLLLYRHFSHFSFSLHNEFIVSLNQSQRAVVMFNFKWSSFIVSIILSVQCPGATAEGTECMAMHVQWDQKQLYNYQSTRVAIGRINCTLFSTGMCSSEAVILGAKNRAYNTCTDNSPEVWRLIVARTVPISGNSDFEKIVSRNRNTENFWTSGFFFFFFFLLGALA